MNVKKARSPINISSTTNFYKEQQKPNHQLDTSENFSDNLICDRFEKLNCRPKKEEIINDIEQQFHHNYENFDVIHNIRNADIQIQQSPSSSNYHNHQKLNFDSIGNYSQRDKILVSPLPPSPSFHPLSHIQCTPENKFNLIDYQNSWYSEENQILSREHSKSIKSNKINTLSSLLCDEEIPSQLNTAITTNKLENINDIDLSVVEDFDELKKIQQEKSDEVSKVFNCCNLKNRISQV